MSKQTTEPGRAHFQVLIVDDDITARILARQALEADGFTVVEAEHGGQALEVFQQALPDIVLMDVDMPVMNGYEACRQLRNLPCGKLTPTLMVTGQDDMESVQQAYQVGATDFITKPLNWQIICQRIRYMIRASAERTQLQELKQSEFRLDNAQRIAGLGSWEWDLQNNSTYWSDQLYRMTGRHRGTDQPSLSLFLEHVPASERFALKRWIKHAISRSSASGTSTHHQLLSSGGNNLHVQHQIEIHTDPEGESCLIFGTVLDVTALKAAESKVLSMMNALAESDKRLRSSNAELAHALTEKRQLLHRVINTQEYERSYLAQELHDDLGQLLTAVQAEAAVLDARVGQDTDLAESIAAIRGCTATMYDTVYNRICTLKPLELSNLGLLAALPEMHIIKSLRSMGMTVNIQLAEAIPVKNEQLDTNLYRVVQEALSNVAKHAQATEVSIRLDIRDNRLLLHIDDDGVGYSREQGSSPGSATNMAASGYGVLGMRERVESLGGDFYIHNLNGRGCQIRIRVPLEALGQ